MHTTPHFTGLCSDLVEMKRFTMFKKIASWLHRRSTGAVYLLFILEVPYSLGGNTIQNPFISLHISHEAGIGKTKSI